MGFSYRTDAGRVEKAWQEGCRAQTGSSNTFEDKGVRYFYELSRRDQPDGGICGTIWKSVPPPVGKDGDYYSKVGTFKIDGNGNIVRAPRKLKEFAAEKNRSPGNVFVTSVAR